MCFWTILQKRLRQKPCMVGYHELLQRRWGWWREFGGLDLGPRCCCRWFQIRFLSPQRPGNHINYAVNWMFERKHMAGMVHNFSILVTILITNKTHQQQSLGQSENRAEPINNNEFKSLSMLQYDLTLACDVRLGYIEWHKDWWPTHGHWEVSQFFEAVSLVRHWLPRCKQVIVGNERLMLAVAIMTYNDYLHWLFICEGCW